jgi:penicillin-binding protein 2
MRQLLIPVFLLLVFGIFFAKLTYIQVVAAPAIKDRALRTSQVSVDTLAPRGLIVDRKGRLIAGLETAWVITGIPRVVSKNEGVLEQVAAILEIEPEDIQKRLDDGYLTKDLPVVVHIGATLNQVTRIAEAGGELPGFGTETRALRSITDPFAFSHVLGFVGIPNAASEERLNDLGLKIPEFTGRDGIEWVYEKDLVGTMGRETMIIDAQGKPIRRKPLELPHPGKKLILSLDLDMQRMATKMLAETPTGRGAVAAIDPSTGEVLCLVSSPSYDLRQWQGGISSKNYQALQDNPDLPLYKRAVSGQYAPGSTYKIITALAAVRNGGISLTKTITCNGGIRVGNKTVECGNHSAGERINFMRAVEKSCNSYFIQTGLDMGPEALADAAYSFGLAQTTGIDLLGEVKGQIPSPESVKQQLADREWYAGDTANISIGQGPLTVTPIQMAMVMSLIANEGKSFKPHLVKATQNREEDPEFFGLEVVSDVSAPPEYWRHIKTGLNKVVSMTGTAWRAVIPGVNWAGKTGSAEHKKGEPTHAWFTGFAPMENPSIAIAVIVEASGHGGEFAAPIAKEIVKIRMFGPPQEESESSDSENVSTDSESPT